MRKKETQMSITTDLRTALEAAISDLTLDQAHAARALIAALTPAMDEPTWPGAPVIAGCPAFPTRLHTRRNARSSHWDCTLCTSTPWRSLIKPRPLTAEEYAQYGIPMPCDHVADGGTVERATQAFREHQGDVPESMRAALVAAGFKAGRVWDEYPA
jgi:hypothetical protein